MTEEWRRWRFEVKWEPRDIWVGVYWTRATFSFHVYVCLLPCLPLHFWRMTEPPPPFPGDGMSDRAAASRGDGREMK